MHREDDTIGKAETEELDEEYDAYLDWLEEIHSYEYQSGR